MAPNVGSVPRSRAIKDKHVVVYASRTRFEWSIAIRSSHHVIVKLGRRALTTKLLASKLFIAIVTLCMAAGVIGGETLINEFLRAESALEKMSLSAAVICVM